MLSIMRCSHCGLPEACRRAGRLGLRHGRFLTAAIGLALAPAADAPCAAVQHAPPALAASATLSRPLARFVRAHRGWLDTVYGIGDEPVWFSASTPRRALDTA